MSTVTVTAQRSSSEPLWRALAVFRFASVGYAALRLGLGSHSHRDRFYHDRLPRIRPLRGEKPS